ncbi:PRTRC system protein E [Noviherbaspirillum galbum]|uniref:PRTRC system protein E n=1 Tax=Noviherbaspirillum galbum TaxID=2709383 RepID=A0A6B3SMY9_9BURK|nr:PRTRC system protein E [Noviherbaspirillum galbum]NEX60106.1 PRTRC system protein E [Noviherbaspirillum galbum]
MFAQLTDLLKQTGLTLTLEAKGEQIQVVVSPKVKAGSNVGLAQPLVLIGSPEELDAEFATALAQFTGARQSLVDQVAISTAALEAAKKATAAKPATAAKSVAAKTLTAKAKTDEDDTLIFGSQPAAASVADDNDDAEEGDDAPALAAAALAPAASVPATSAATSDYNIFA